jgi:hypothetical protein
MKKTILLLILILIIPGILAINLEVTKTSSDEVLIVDIDKPLSVDLSFQNNGASDIFEIYNFAGFLFEPSNVQIGSGETKEITLEASPVGDLDQRGYYTIPYYIRSSDTSEIEEELTFKIIELKEAFEVGSGEVDPESQTMDIYIKNLENVDFGNVSVKFSSVFFEREESFLLDSKEKKTFTVTLNKEDFRRLMAGFYTLTAKVDVLEKEATVEGIIKFVEKDILTTTKKDYGLLINTKIVEKTNEGNTLATSETVIKKNILSRLFTSVSPAPDIVERDGLRVYYTWLSEIPPGETLEIQVRTNWLFPFILILLVVAIVVLVKRYSRTNLVLRKRVAFVRAKGGEFALKVSITVQAKKYVERVNLIDRLPSLVSLHEKFGGDQPTRVDEKNKRIEWNLEKMEAGEMRIVSYIIYSKIGVVGKFALPTATAVFEREGEIHEAESNRAFFVAEQRKATEE